MDEGKILIINLSKGKIGEDNSALLGAMMITKLQLAAMNRVNLPIEKRRDFYLYVDEFQNFSTESFANILSEARKYRLNLILAHQYISQLVNDRNTKVRDAVFGNVGTIACFRIGADDAEYIEREFTPEFVAQDLVNLAKYHIYVKLMIDGVASKPFSAETLEPAKPAAESFKDVIIENSRNKYAAPRSMVEEKIAGEWAADARIIEDKIKRREERPLERVLQSQPYTQPYKQPYRRESQPEKPTIQTKYPDEQKPPSPEMMHSIKERKTINIDDLKKPLKSR